MKKAYVKPVFLAEEFVATMDHVAACPTNTWTPQELQFPINGQGGTRLCNSQKTNCSHYLGSGNATINGYYDEANKITYQQYAEWSIDDRSNAGDGVSDATKAYLFNSGYGACDFVWNNTNQNVGVWVWETENEKWGIKLIEKFGDFGKFFFGAKADNDNHKPAINGTVIPS